ncbi:hypothetical protein LCGC14_1325770 [marine sediment metagenome]|uniref:Uncharacterized protein n=1 Tax=marine sediment metagenome TaxID=412755 RepID=A0A0F9L411_9ZZZZ|nr:hypothetical protein [archaeon]
MFKIEPSRLFFKTFIPSGVINYIGIQKCHSKERSEMNPNLCEDPKSQKRYKIYRKMPLFYHTEEFNLFLMEKAGIEPHYDPTMSSRGYNRYGCFLCPYAGEKYYKHLKKTDSKTYSRCEELMYIASERQIQAGERKERYYYYRKSKIM